MVLNHDFLNDQAKQD